ncbi:MAG: MFS transporter [Bacteroidota bacterium]
MNYSKSIPALLEKNNPKVVNAWCSYDWANSVYNLTVTTAIFPVYYSAVTKEAFGSDMVSFWGMKISNTVLYSYAIAFSYLVIVFLSPILSGVADYSGKKKRFMQFFTYLGSAACLGLYFFRGEDIEYGITCSVLASIGYAGALVFYNAFLPEIVTPDRMDKVSAKGFSMGYIGSVIMLVINLIFITQHKLFGFTNELEPSRLAFLQVGIWWLAFAQIAFYFLKDRPTNQKITSDILGKGFNELSTVLKNVKKQAATPRFLTAFFFYSMGVQTVILLAPLFGESVIHLKSDKLIMTVLLLQIVAVIGSQLFAQVASRKGNKVALAICLCIWVCVCIGAFNLQTETQFFVLAGFLGLVLGGTQAISRSTYAKLIPADTTDLASYFSLYDVCEKLAIVIGTFSYGFINQITGNMRYSSLAMIVFFAIGLIFLLTTRLAHNQRLAGGR